MRSTPDAGLVVAQPADADGRAAPDRLLERQHAALTQAFDSVVPVRPVWPLPRPPVPAS